MTTKAAAEDALDLKKAEAERDYLVNVLYAAGVAWDAGAWDGEGWSPSDVIPWSDRKPDVYPSPCPTCGAARGVPCHEGVWGKGLRPRTDVHVARSGDEWRR